MFLWEKTKCSKFKVGVEYGTQFALDNQQATSNIDAATIFMIEDENNKK